MSEPTQRDLERAREIMSAIYNAADPDLPAMVRACAQGMTAERARLAARVRDECTELYQEWKAKACPGTWHDSLADALEADDE